jgi:hypothetical protein
MPQRLLRTLENDTISKAMRSIPGTSMTPALVLVLGFEDEGGRASQQH